MEWPAIVRGAQMLSALAWLFVVIRYMPSVVRLLRGHPIAWDAAGSWAWLSGVVQVGFVMRWIFLVSGELLAADVLALKVWTGLYIVNAAVAVGIIHTYQDNNYAASMVRARHGVAAWFGVGVCCVGAALWVN